MNLEGPFYCASNNVLVGDDDRAVTLVINRIVEEKSSAGAYVSVRKSCLDSDGQEEKFFAEAYGNQHQSLRCRMESSSIIAAMTRYSWLISHQSGNQYVSVRAANKRGD